MVGWAVMWSVVGNGAANFNKLHGLAHGQPQRLEPEWRKIPA
jgi:hypothetical protein